VVQKGLSMRGKGGMEKALKFYEEAIGQYGRRPEFFEAIAEIYKANKEYAKVKEIHEQIIKEFPDDVTGVVDLADDYFYLDRDESKAIRLLENSAGAHPDAVELFLKLGELCYYAGDVERMEKSLRHALSLDPFPDPYSATSPYYYLAKGLIEKEEYEEAEKLIDFGLKELEPNNPQMRAELAFIFFEKGREKEGLKHIDKALEAAWGLPHPTEIKALYLTRQGEIKFARASLEGLVKKIPERIECRVQLARLIMESEPDKARRLLDEGLKIASKKGPIEMMTRARWMEGKIAESRLHTAYGDLLEKTGEIELAIEHHKKAWDLFKYNYPSAVSLVRLYRKSGRDEEAEKAYEKLRSLSPPERYLKEKGTGSFSPFFLSLSHSPC